MWDEFTALAQRGLEAPIAQVGGGDDVFVVSARQLTLLQQNRELTASFAAAGVALEGKTATLLEDAGAC